MWVKLSSGPRHKGSVTSRSRKRRAKLGGLVIKADLVELLDDDRATLLGALLDVARQLRGTGDDGTDPAHLCTRWRRAARLRGKQGRNPAYGGQEGGRAARNGGCRVMWDDAELWARVRRCQHELRQAG